MQTYHYSVETGTVGCPPKRIEYVQTRREAKTLTTSWVDDVRKEGRKVSGSTKKQYYAIEPGMYIKMDWHNGPIPKETNK